MSTAASSSLTDDIHQQQRPHAQNNKPSEALLQRPSRLQNVSGSAGTSLSSPAAAVSPARNPAVMHAYGAGMGGDTFHPDDEGAEGASHHHHHPFEAHAAGATAVMGSSGSNRHLLHGAASSGGHDHHDIDDGHHHRRNIQQHQQPDEHAATGHSEQQERYLRGYRDARRGGDDNFKDGKHDETSASAAAASETLQPQTQQRRFRENSSEYFLDAEGVRRHRADNTVAAATLSSDPNVSETVRQEHFGQFHTGARVTNAAQSFADCWKFAPGATGSANSAIF